MSAFKLSLLASVVALAATGCASNTPAMTDQQLADTLAANLGVNYQLVTNHGANEGLKCQELQAEWASCDLINLTLTNNGPAVDSKDWKIYFHSIRMILEVQNEQFKVTHVTGDLHTLEPTDKFEGFAEGESVVIPYIGEYWTLFETDYMPRSYVVAGDSTPETIVSTDHEDPSAYTNPIEGDNWKRTPADNNVLATAKSRFEKNSDVDLLAKEEVAGTIIPTPLSTKLTGGKVSLANGISIENKALPTPMLEAATTRMASFGIDTNGDYPVKLYLDPSRFSQENKVSGAYLLDVRDGVTTVVGYDYQGAFYGLQSLMSLMGTGAEQTIPTLKVSDAPRFDYRGVMVDVGRNFHSKEAILRTLDQMAAFKMNKFHFHLSDDEGWRIEIPGLPELTEIGSQRCHDLSETTCLLPQLGSGPTSDNFGSGYYSTEDYLEILHYAKARGIEVIPELDMPAHSRAAVISMEARYKRLAEAGDMAAAEQYRLTDPQDTSNVTTVQFYDKYSFINPCMDSSLNFVDKVISEMAAMHKQAGMPLNTWHYGADEAKNIKLGAGFQDLNSDEKVAWKGDLDLSAQDKPFAQSPMCQKLLDNGEVEDFAHLAGYFGLRVSEIAASKGVANFQAWNDGLKYLKGGADQFASENVRVNHWDVLYWGGGTAAYDWAAKGYDMIASNPDYLYMDMPYEVDPKERGYYWATRATDTRKMFGFAPENLPQNAETSVDRDGNGFVSKGNAEASIYGMSAQLWSETVRTDEQYEYMVFPRVIAAAQRAWHQGEWENEYKVGVEYSQQTQLVDKEALTAEWQRFANTLGQRELAKLDAAGVNYRVPVPGAKVEAGVLHMNVSMPGLVLQYSTDGGENWTNYDAKAKPAVSGDVQIRAISANGQRFSRVTSL